MKPHQNPDVSLQALADIKPGYPFRGAIKNNPNGTAHVVQIRHLDPVHGFGDDRLGDLLDRVTLSGKRKPDYLCPGDLLFVSRGSRFFAAIVPDTIPEHTVCSPHFFLIRLTESSRSCITPEFLAWQINHQQAQLYLSRGRQGSLQPSVSKTLLKALPITLPSLERQRLVTSFHRALKEEAALMAALIENREQQLRALSTAVLSEARESEPSSLGHNTTWPLPATTEQG
jgi:hypothetical protein